MPEMRTHKESWPVLLTPREVAATLRVDLSTVYRMIDRGTIGAVQFGGARHTVRIPAAELVRLSASLKPAAGGAAPLGVGALARARAIADLPRTG
jgi:excisionase family DNA binding protein